MPVDLQKVLNKSSGGDSQSLQVPTTRLWGVTKSWNQNKEAKANSREERAPNWRVWARKKLQRNISGKIYIFKNVWICLMSSSNQRMRTLLKLPPKSRRNYCLNWRSWHPNTVVETGGQMRWLIRQKANKALNSKAERHQVITVHDRGSTERWFPEESQAEGPCTLECCVRFTIDTPQLGSRTSAWSRSEALARSSWPRLAGSPEGTPRKNTSRRQSHSTPRTAGPAPAAGFRRPGGGPWAERSFGARPGGAGTAARSQCGGGRAAVGARGTEGVEEELRRRGRVRCRGLPGATAVCRAATVRCVGREGLSLLRVSRASRVVRRGLEAGRADPEGRSAPRQVGWTLGALQKSFLLLSGVLWARLCCVCPVPRNLCASAGFLGFVTLS